MISRNKTPTVNEDSTKFKGRPFLTGARCALLASSAAMVASVSPSDSYCSSSDSSSSSSRRDHRRRKRRLLDRDDLKVRKRHRERTKKRQKHRSSHDSSSSDSDTYRLVWYHYVLHLSGYFMHWIHLGRGFWLVSFFVVSSPVLSLLGSFR